MDDAGFGEVPIVRMLLQREVLDGVDANVATPQLLLLLNWGDQALQVLALNFFHFLQTSAYSILQLEQPSEQIASGTCVKHRL